MEGKIQKVKDVTQGLLIEIDIINIFIFFHEDYIYLLFLFIIRILFLIFILLQRCTQLAPKMLHPPS